MLAIYWPAPGENVGMGAVGRTVNDTLLLATPATVTTTGPVVAPDGTVAVIDVLLFQVAVAGVPLNVTVLVLCVVPKFVPVIVTGALIPPDVGDRLAIVGGNV
jgi:hypothetical protein